ncbi:MULTISPECIES: flagellar hook-basal body complex protein [unclassified Lysinibacillus]|uniref:flagellar hook-basal body complex protein n=1 Tax=unclassified Lysinibacillus TaxID=2636778 RepID=UPI002010E9F5|nr:MULTISPECIES: flagellar hook-basal body complex protein [unclassified Lysinibacillus]MCL1695459.1 flagellar hook-basal body complex protein [Lysinibacillus sp. BPa_S21]MCL1700297.1 flagellar hook-basal body complex protein [Lysinibacillus sp. Bpr_S20]
MLRSMYSGISGLKNFQTKLDVIGNNIANVNTYGFKKGRVVFKDLMSQTSAGASSPTQTRGGVNAKQIGLGSQLAAIDTIHGAGSMQNTFRELDLAIAGDGFFMVGDANGAPDEDGALDAEGYSNILYTRAGNFYMDRNGYLVNADGKYLVGHANDELSISADESIDGAAAEEHKAGNGLADIEGNIAEEMDFASEISPIRIPTTAQSMSIGQDGTVTYTDYKGERQYAGQLILAKFPNAGGLQKVGGNYYQPTANSGEPYAQVGTVGGIGAVEAGFLEMSNVDLSEEFTEMIVAQRGFQSNTRIITTSDEILQELVNLKR